MLNTKVVHRARTGRALGKHSPKVAVYNIVMYVAWPVHCGILAYFWAWADVGAVSGDCNQL